MPKYEHAELALLSERPIEEIVGREPSWIVRSGITLISIVFLAILILTWFIRYPDTVQAEILITTLQPPTKIVSRVSGQILKLYISNNEDVKKDQVLLLLESTLDYTDLNLLEIELSTLKEFLESSSINVKIINEYYLGELQPSLDKLVNAIKELSIESHSKQLSMHTKHINILRKQYQILDQQLIEKRITWGKKLDLEIDILQKKRELFENGIITSSEMLPQESSFLDKQLALNDINIESNLYGVKLKELAHSLAEYKTQRLEKLQHLKNSVHNHYLSLVSEITDWKKNYLITSPIDGQVSFSEYWSVNQYINAGDVILLVANKNKEIAGKIKIGQTGIGKIRIGQTVNIELKSYSAMEYGKLIGVITSVSSTPGAQGYLVNVSLPTKLITTYGKKLPFSQNLEGTAKVITDERRLLERFLEKILYVFSR